MWHKLCRSFHPWCPGVKNRCLFPLGRAPVTGGFLTNANDAELWCNGSAHNRDAGDLRRHRAQYYVTVIYVHILRFAAFCCGLIPVKIANIIHVVLLQWFSQCQWRNTEEYGRVGHTNPQNNSLLWRHNGQDSVSNHQPRHCLLSRLFGHRSNKKKSKLRVTGLCAGEFPAQMASNAENISI